MSDTRPGCGRSGGRNAGRRATRNSTGSNGRSHASTSKLPPSPGFGRAALAERLEAQGFAGYAGPMRMPGRREQAAWRLRRPPDDALEREHAEHAYEARRLLVRRGIGRALAVR